MKSANWNCQTWYNYILNEHVNFTNSFFNVILSVWLPILSYFFYEWTRIGCKYWSWHDFKCWPSPSGILAKARFKPTSDRESSSLTTRPDLRPNFTISLCAIFWTKVIPATLFKAAFYKMLAKLTKAICVLFFAS